MTASDVDYAPLDLPASDRWSSWLQERADGELERATALAAELRDAPPDGALDVLLMWNQVQLAIANVSGLCSLLAQVHPDPELQAQAEDADQAARRLSTRLGLDPGLYAVLQRLDPSTLDDDASRVHRLTLRDFTRAGVDRDADTRDRLQALAERETALGQEFSKNIRSDVRSVRLTTDQLAGLPADYLDSHPADPDGLHTVTTDYPDVFPLLTYGSDPAARLQAHLAFMNRAWPDNDPVLRELLELRAEHAHLLGYDGWPDYDAEIKMIGTGKEIGAFIDRIAAASASAARSDRDVLLARLQQDRPDVDVVMRSDSMYYSELVRRETYDVDAQDVRTYFEFEKVRQGLLEVTSRLFGLRYLPVPRAATWHDDVAVYDVELEGRRIGRIHLDLHPRDGKYKHAAQFDLTRGVAGHQLAEGALVCNFPRGLMEHRDVVTLFHEFGHLMHHVLAGSHRWVRFSGVATEWDFVEAPSQMLEEWAWDADVLATFATDESGSAIPADLVQRMRAAHDFGRAAHCRTQMCFASISYQLHVRLPDDITQRVSELQAEYDMFPFAEGTHFHASFGHLAGYTSAYYTYMWSLVIAKDLFGAFDRRDLFDTETAHRYRDAILAPGGSRDAADLVADFLGRPYSFDAFTRWLESGDSAAGRPK